jgi:hypothetical protein
MKKFLIKSLFFFLLIVVTISTILMAFGGYVDYFYEKFTTPKAQSLILGDSRSMQGIQPAVINDYLSSSEYSLPMMNYSFTIAQIAYGPLYSESVRKKLDPTTKNGLFILTVNPWILSSREGDDEKNGVFFEKDMPPHNMELVSMNPNIEYLIKNFNYFHFKSIIRRTSKMHKDGWLEESNLPKDIITLNEWKDKQVIMYNGYASEWEKSEFRLQSFESLIKYLKDFGTVLLIRMPIDEKIIDIENNYWFNFDLEINGIANKTNTHYINFTTVNNDYKTYDGNHLDKFGGVTFTKNICDSIIIKHKSNNKAK